jgi:superfamily II DNA or RNA helicase
MAPAKTESVKIPAAFSGKLVIDRNPVRQVLHRGGLATVVSTKKGEFSVRFEGGVEARLLVSTARLRKGERALIPKPISVLRRTPKAADLTTVRWVGDLSRNKPSVVLDSFKGKFEFVEEDPKTGSGGLRVPQLGAIHAILGYWTTSTTIPATVVMPTGTGKTEAMLGLLAAARPNRLLVLVPSDTLRDQIAAKFESFGVLQEFGIVSISAMRPVVGRVAHKFSSATQARDFASPCNVIVATPQALTASPAEVRKALLAECSHLFVDEAHHVAAATWKEIRDAFADKGIVQFTATPFREDGRRMGGRIVYAFPLREAQKQGYFSHINYHSIVDFENQDRAIAVKAVELLRADLAKGLDHVIMARVGRIGRAPEILAIYQELGGDLRPVLLHSGVGAAERKTALADLRSRKSRIIVCVDMLGEGFDLPSLKIAAIHDAHRSLGVTLQFVGRFARVAGSKIGEASVVVARPDSDYDDNLRRLYAEDADWNLIIRKLSEAAVGAEEEVSEFEAEFNEIPEQVSLANLIPKMSTVVYRTKADAWVPDNITNVFPEESLLTVPIPVNATDHVAWFVTEINSQVPWGDSRTVQDLTHDLYIVYWDEDKKLLYINSSNKESLHEGLAEALSGEDVVLLRGENVYRIMAQVDRLVPTNMGVLDYRNRSRRFSMHVGADVGEAFPTAEAQTKTKTNIFAYGFEGGTRVSVGASLKGRVWSYRVAVSIKNWMDWCDHVGSKLVDESISVDEVMKHFIRPEALKERPALAALALEWPYEVFLNTSDEVKVEIGEPSWPLVDADLQITTFSTTGPIPFKVVTPNASAAYEATLTDDGLVYRAIGVEANILLRETRTPLSEWLTRHGLTIHLEQDASITPEGFLLKPDRDLPSFDTKRLVALDWKGIDIRKESQGKGKAADSVQARVIKHVAGLANWQLIIDDDGAGEIADIVAIRADDKELHVLLVHCKFSSSATPGHRVEDLYEVCGQANKSVKWKRNTGVFFRNLIRREKKRLKTRGRTGFEKGNAQTLSELADRARLLKPNFAITLAQPGMSKAEVSKEQLELLASTEVYVHETANAPLEVLCSP